MINVTQDAPVDGTGLPVDGYSDASWYYMGLTEQQFRSLSNNTTPSQPDALFNNDPWALPQQPTSATAGLASPARPPASIAPLQHAGETRSEPMD